MGWDRSTVINCGQLRRLGAGGVDHLAAITVGAAQQSLQETMPTVIGFLGSTSRMDVQYCTVLRKLQSEDLGSALRSTTCKSQVVQSRYCCLKILLTERFSRPVIGESIS